MLQWNKYKTFKPLIENLINVIAFLLNIINQKDEQLLPKFRLVDWIEKKGIGYCKIHVIGTTMVNNYLPSVIVANDEFISGFDKMDIRTITNLANSELVKPLARIASINHELNCVKIIQNGCEEVMLNIDNVENIIEQFNKKDAFNLGRLIGENDIKP